MAYSQKARKIRQCKAKKKDGTQCQAFARWNESLCSSHTISRRRPYTCVYRRWRSPAICRCVAYQWPHRPGSGLCEWPDEPRFVHKTPAGTHAWPRISGSDNSTGRALRKIYAKRP